MKKVQEKNSDPADSGLFISRELSWIDFNARVLDEAGCAANPVLERLKFIAIFSSNLDEFFMVRIAGLRQLVKMGQDLPDPAGNRPSEQLARMRKKLDRLLKRQHDCLMDEILPELGRRGVKLVRPADVAAPVRAELSSYFRGQVLPVLTPLAVDSAHPVPDPEFGIDRDCRQHASGRAQRARIRLRRGPGAPAALHRGAGQPARPQLHAA